MPPPPHLLLSALPSRCHTQLTMLHCLSWLRQSHQLMVVSSGSQSWSSSACWGSSASSKFSSSSFYIICLFVFYSFFVMLIIMSVVMVIIVGWAESYLSTNSRRPSLSFAKRKASSPKQFKALVTLASSILYDSVRSVTAANEYGGKNAYRAVMDARIFEQPCDFFVL